MDKEIELAIDLLKYKILALLRREKNLQVRTIAIKLGFGFDMQEAQQGRFTYTLLQELIREDKVISDKVRGKRLYNHR